MSLRTWWSKSDPKRFAAAILGTAIAVGSVSPTRAYTPGGVTDLGAKHVTQCHPFPFSDISASGRYVAVSSPAPLVSGDTNLACDIFVGDLRMGTVERVSVASSGAQSLISHVAIPPWAVSYWPSISADGRYIAFTSYANNLVPGDTNDDQDVFVHDRERKTTIRVSVTSEGEQGDAGSRYPSISSDGRYVAFESGAALAGDSPGIFVHDLRKKVTMKVDDDPRSQSNAVRPSISGNGRFVIYTVNPYMILVRDLKTGKTEVASVFPDGSEPIFTNVDSYGFSMGGHWISDSGRFVVFSSHVSGYVPNDTNPRCDAVRASSPDVFVRDLKTERTERVSVYSTGEEAEFGAGPGAPGGSTEGCGYTAAGISGDGRFVSFSSSTNFFKGDDGELLASGWVGGQPGMTGDVDSFVYDRKDGTLHWTSVASDSTEANCTSQAAALSRNARYATFISCADNLVKGDDLEDVEFKVEGLVLGDWDLFVRDLGMELGVGGFGDSPDEEPAAGDQICVAPDICIPPLGAATAEDRRSDVSASLTELGANLYGVSMVYRPTHEDLFARIELEDMPSLKVGVNGLFSTSGSPPILYGLRFGVKDRRYEVRATSLLGGSFALFDCTDRGPRVCSKVTDLRGGYGTTGERVVFSLPLPVLGLQSGGELSNVEAFTAVGDYTTGPLRILDTVRLDAQR